MPRFFLTEYINHTPALVIEHEKITFFFPIMAIAAARSTSPSKFKFYSPEHKHALHHYNIRNHQDTSNRLLIPKLESLAEDITWATDRGIALLPKQDYPIYGAVNSCYPTFFNAHTEPKTLFDRAQSYRDNVPEINPRLCRYEISRSEN